MDNIMPEMIGKLYKMLKMFKWYRDTPTLDESITGPYKDEFIQAMTQYIM